MSIEKARDGPLLLLRPLPAFAGMGGLFDPSIGLEGRKYFGFDFRDVDSLAVLEIESDSFDTIFQIVRGNISSRVASHLMPICSACIQPEIREHDGIEYWSWPLNPLGRDIPPLFDAQRNPTRLIINDGVVMQALDEAGIEALIDLARGTGKSMADDENLVRLVMAMDEFGASSAVISAPTVTLDVLLDGRSVRESRELEEIATMAPLLRPYLAVATGVGRNDKGRFTVVALVHETEEAAHENAYRLSVRFRDIINRIDSSSEPPTRPDQTVWGTTVVDGNILIMRLRRSEGFFTQNLLGRDNTSALLVHE